MSHHYEPSAGRPDHHSNPQEHQFETIKMQDKPAEGKPIIAPEGHESPTSMKVGRKTAPTFRNAANAAEQGPKPNNLSKPLKVHRYRHHGD